MIKCLVRNICAHKWTRICSICSNHNPVLSSCMPFYRVYNKSNTTSANSGAGSSCPIGEPEFTPVFSGVRVARTVVLFVVLCRPLFFFIWPLHCLSFDLRLSIIPLVSSNHSLASLSRTEDWLGAWLHQNDLWLAKITRRQYIYR